MVRRSRRVSRRRSGRVSRRRVSRRRSARVSRRRSRRRMSGGMSGKIRKKGKNKVETDHEYSQATQEVLMSELTSKVGGHYFTSACVKSQSLLLKATLDQAKQRGMPIQAVIIALEKSLDDISKKDKASVRSVIDILTKTLDEMKFTKPELELLPEAGQDTLPSAGVPLARQPSVGKAARAGSPMSEQQLEMLEQKREQTRIEEDELMKALRSADLPKMK
uniref:Uncharacterized protein n=1 Tax=viral metagenome TaxID=1070528 RepID=A0A6C0F6P6_9ZZZZ|tara:strand:- start:2561 stop:3220 length:660 start_codon:yes stop_codon:yes gene_type:complete